MATSESTRVVNAALVGNLLVMLTKVAAALVTGSSAMRSEAVHSAVDTGNELLLLYGLRKAARPPDADHPFGHGREIYFWRFIVALLFFALGAVVSVYQGLQHLREPVEINRPVVNYVVLGLALLFEGGSWRVALSISARPRARWAISKRCGTARTPPPSPCWPRTRARSSAS